MRRLTGFSILWLALMSAMIGCQSGKPRELKSTTAIIEFDSYAGTLLSGPFSAGFSPGDSKDAWQVNLKLIALEQDPGAVLGSAGSASRYIRLERTGEAYQAVNQLAQRLRVGSGDEARSLAEQIEAGKFGLTREFAARELALPENVTTRLSIDDKHRKEPRQIDVAMHRSLDPSTKAGRLELLITVRDLVQFATESETTQPSKPTSRIDIESALLDPILVSERETIALVSPLVLSGTDAKGLALLIEIEPGTDSDEHNTAYARLIDEIHTTGETTKSRMTGGSWPGLEAALEGASKPETRRASLQFLANQTGAVIAIDLILLADSDLLATFTKQINDAINASALDRKPQLLGWLMDRVALELLTKQLSNDAKIPGELRTILLRHAGEAGRDSASMTGMLRGLQSRQELAARLIAENLIALEDTSPATRVRAFDWLASIGKAPPTYDPLGDDDARKAALATLDQ